VRALPALPPFLPNISYHAEPKAASYRRPA
jgi:hypothetical protein